MNVVIVGAGKLGENVAKHLSGENHNIVIIDQNRSFVEDLVNVNDVKGLCGNGTIVETLLDAEANKADVFIAVTNSDETNILSCLVAKKLGAKKTIARVRDPEYAKQVSWMSKELGLSFTINPELEAAKEISRIFKYPVADKVETFANGRVDLVEFKIDKASPLNGMKLIDFRSKYQMKVLFCIVKRGEYVTIPNGEFKLLENDIVYITAEAKEMANFFRKFKLIKETIKSTMIIGGGMISHYLASELIEFGFKVIIVEKDKEVCSELSASFPNVLVINGDGNDQKILLEEGIDKINSVITLTGIDETNILISTFAQSLNVPKVITKVNNNYYSLICNKLGLNCIIDPKEIASSNMIRYVRGLEGGLDSDFKSLHRLVNDQVEALEFVISKKTKFTNIPISKLTIKNNILLAAIIRQNRVIIPSGNDYLEQNDSIVIITPKTRIKDLEDIFG